MNPEFAGGVAVVVLLALIFLGIPVAFCLVFVGFFGYWAISGFEPAIRMAAMTPYSKLAVYTMTAIPLFMIMGNFAHNSGIATELFDSASKWVGRLPGGIVQATIVLATGLAAVCGSGMSSCAVVAKIAVPQMLRLGVNRPLAFGSVASVGTIAQMIPPSIPMVIYGVIAEQSVGKLLMAGVVPGIITALNYMIMIYIRCRLNPRLVPVQDVQYSWKERFSAAKGFGGVGLLAVAIIGGLYSGVFTPTEAGAVGAFLAFLLFLRKFKWSLFRESVMETVRATSMVMMIVSCALIFGYLISVARIPSIASEYLATLPRWWLLIGVLAFYFILGFFLDMVAAVYITLPIILPAIEAAGFNMIWFGVLIVQEFELALITPPFAINIFVIRGVIPDTTTKEVISGVWPFVWLGLIDMTIFVAFPQISLFLPNLMLGK